jgi:catechol 2,3-dioxygenase-like lactoylglutathione lyase family enzyme
VPLHLIDAFVQACRDGDADVLRDLLEKEPSLVRERVASGVTGLHLAARHAQALRVLIAHGADPNARDTGDNASPLHVAAAEGQLESVRVLLDAGADVHGAGDLHHGDVIGWATRKGNEPVIDLLLAHGAHHHIYSAMALRDYPLVRRLVADDPRALLRRRSRFENSQTPLHAAFAPPDGLGRLAGEPDHAMLALLIELGADVEATDDKGRTALAVAMLRGDHEAMRILTAAGAATPALPPQTGDTGELAQLASSVTKSAPMFRVADMRATVRWYQALGFRVHDEYEAGGELTFARLSFGSSELALSPGARTGPRDVSLWLFTDRIDEIYQLVKARQLRATRSREAGDSQALEIRFDEDLYTPFHGGRQFSVRDPNGLSLIFFQPTRGADPAS